MYHPPRGGVRGGRTDKHRENYLGHSLHAPVGRWQQGKDLTWYAKDGKHDDSRNEEIRAIKNAEADVMAELLGGGKRRVVTGNVTQQELSNVLKRQQDEEEDSLKEATQEVTKGFSSGRLSISEMVSEDTLLQDDSSISHRDNKKRASTLLQSEDKRKAKKVKKEEKRKKHKKEKHRSKDKHTKSKKNESH
ncbi:15389_t:CDS:2 [Funneliformis geosporum]|uniref:15389_t:CDS:1 n=1 Tax=Funneliformis geosporum TaxID=1117311 RepID=A0A9W4SPB7_9GLOM|nr:15389_t:CDS:2 [Funneliformis geosporum]